MRVFFFIAAWALSAAPARAQDRLQQLEDRINKLEASAAAPAKTALNAFNPQMGISLDMGYAHNQNDKGTFEFRSAELNLGAAIDPFLKGWAIINAAPGGVGLEEGAIQTTSLPWNLQVTAGRLFASFGRLGHFHNHELPVYRRPRSLQNFIGDESQADGIEVAYLFPTPFYLRAVAGGYNKIGGGNDRVANNTARPLDEFTYLGRLSAYGDWGDHSLELGVHSAWTPKRTMVEDAATTGAPIALITRKNTWRALTGTDLTYRWEPAAGGIYKGLVWSTEVLANNERRFNANRLPVDRVRAFAGFSYVMLKLGRHWRPGVLIDLTEDLDTARSITRTWAPFLTFDVTEFQRLRLTYQRTSSSVPGVLPTQLVALQWSAILGYHAHAFRDR